MPNARTSHSRETQARRPLIASPGEMGASTRALPTALVGGNTNPTWEDRPSERDAAGGNACTAGLCCCTKPGVRLTPHPVTLGPAGRAVPEACCWAGMSGLAEQRHPPTRPPVGAGGRHHVWGQSIITIFRMDRRCQEGAPAGRRQWGTARVAIYALLKHS